MELTCCHGNRDDVRIIQKYCPKNRVTKLFIVCPHDQIQFFVMFHNVTNTTTMKIPLRASLNFCSELIYSEGMAPIRKTQ